MKPIMSFWSEPYIRGFSNPWINPSTWNLSWILSVESVTKVYGKPHLYTDLAGKNFLVNELGLSFESIDLSLTDIKGMNPKFFSLGRTYAMGLQKEPFFHIDYDAYLFDKIPDELTSSEIFFEKDMFNYIGGNAGSVQRPDLFSSVKNIPNWWNLYAKKEFHCYKMGIFGGSNLDYFNKLSQSIFDIVNSNTKEVWEDINNRAKNNTELLSSHLFIPQYTLDEYLSAALAKEMKISPTFMISGTGLVKTKYAHIHGNKSDSSEVYGRVLNRLVSDYPDTKETIKKLEPNKEIEVPKVSIVVMPNKYSSVYDSLLRAIIPRKITPDEVVVSDFMLSDIDRKLISNIEGVKIVPGGSSYLESIKKAFRKTSNGLIIFIDGHVKVPKLYIEKVIAAYLEYPNTVFCTASTDFSENEDFISYGGLENSSGVYPNLVKNSDAILDIPRVPCLYGGVYAFPNKALHLINESSNLSFNDVSKFLEHNGFDMRCIKGILVSNGFKKPSNEEVVV